jgi:hypothetical protein
MAFALECVRLEPKHGWREKVAGSRVETPLWQNTAQPAIGTVGRAQGFT